jgi:hypothetical protein
VDVSPKSLFTNTLGSVATKSWVTLPVRVTPPRYLHKGVCRRVCRGLTRRAHEAPSAAQGVRCQTRGKYREGGGDSLHGGMRLSERVHASE